MYIEQLAQILEDEGIGTIGTNIFVFSAPANTENYILLMLGGDGIPVDNDLPGYYNTKYQVIVRNKNYEDGMILANDAKEALTFYGKSVGGISFKHSLPRDEPRPYRRNVSGIIEFSNNFLVCFTKE